MSCIAIHGILGSVLGDGEKERPREDMGMAQNLRPSQIECCFIGQCTWKEGFPIRMQCEWDVMITDGMQEGRAQTHKYRVMVRRVQMRTGFIRSCAHQRAAHFDAIVCNAVSRETSR